MRLYVENSQIRHKVTFIPSTFLGLHLVKHFFEFNGVQNFSADHQVLKDVEIFVKNTQKSDFVTFFTQKFLFT